MMACSYLSAGGVTSDTSGAACWGPPAAADARLPLPPSLMTLPCGPMAIPGARTMHTGLANLPNLTGVPRAATAQPRAAQPQRTGPSETPTRLIGFPAMGPMGLPSEHTLPSGTALPPVSNVPPPPRAFTRPLPVELGSSPERGSLSEPALDLSTSASSLKRRASSSELVE